MRIKSKFDSTCEVCNQPIRKGTEIEWEQGAGARHVVCIAPSSDIVTTVEPWMFTDDDPVFRIARGNQSKLTP